MPSIAPRGAVRAAIGLRAHSGWAAAVAMGFEAGDPRVLLRARLELAKGSREGPVQPYHVAEPMPIEQARLYLDRCRVEAFQFATRGLGQLLADLEALGAKPAVCALLAGSGRALPELRAILASHALIHSADGEHFREAIADAARSLKLPVIRVREKEVFSEASATLGLTEARLKARLVVLGKSVGAPWTADQKLATLAAWTAHARSTLPDA